MSHGNRCGHALEAFKPDHLRSLGARQARPLTANFERFFGRRTGKQCGKVVRLSGKFNEGSSRADGDVFLLEQRGQGPGVHLVEVDQLLQVGELCFPSVQRIGSLPLVDQLKQKSFICFTIYSFVDFTLTCHELFLEKVV